MDYNAGFCGSDCVIRNGARLNGFAKNGGSLKTSAVTSTLTTTVQNGYRRDLKNGHSFGSNGYTLGIGDGQHVKEGNGIKKPEIPEQHQPKVHIPADNSESCDSYYKNQYGKAIQRRRRANVTVKESFEQCSLLDALYTYMCYAFLAMVGYVNDLIRPRESTEKFRAGYVTLYASFESFYTRHVYRRVRNLWNIPVASVPGEYINLIERVTPDNGWTFEYTGKLNRCINMGSYNYLGFAENHGACSQAAIETCKHAGVATAGTRLELGSATYHDELEQLVARFVGTEDAITCGMGFATNTLNIPSILGKGCLVISDEKNHASIILGLRLSGATIRVFKHNNMKHLEKRLREGIISGQPRTHLPWRKIFIFVEGVYSMEGSICRLPEIIELKKKYGAYIYLDEAHSIGAIGENGRGVVDYFGLNPTDVDILMGTFTKSFGSGGGYIAGTHELIEKLRRRSHSNHYGTSMAPAVATQIMASMKIIMGEDGTNDGIRRVSRLKRNSRYFRQKLMQKGFIVYGNDDSPVVPVALYSPSKITYVISEMIKRGVATVGVGYPATALVEGRARFCISASHTKEMLDKTLEIVDEIGGHINAKSSKLPKRSKEIIYEESDGEEDLEEEEID